MDLLVIFLNQTNNKRMCLFNYCRYADAPCGEHFSGHSDWIPEHSRGDEPVQFQAADEHLFRPAAHCQHLRGLWKVWSGGTGFKSSWLFPINTFRLTLCLKASPRNGQRWFSRERWARIPRTPRQFGRSTSSGANRETFTDDRVSYHRTTIAWTGWCGSLPSRWVSKAKHKIITCTSTWV